jgi:energy-coupling factor transport system substrate-specific component
MIVEMVVLAMMGSLMFCSRVIMALLPNIHLLGMFIMILTIVFRHKALISLYIYVLIEGLYSGFALWWVPYLYVWTVLWAVTMLLPRRMPRLAKAIVYPIVCCLHGAFFGVLYAPGQALLYGLDFDGMIAWILVGLTFDILHSVGDLAAGLLVLPMSELLEKLMKKGYRS